MFKNILLVLLILITGSCAFARSNDKYKADEIRYQGYVVHAPAGISCPAVLSSEINSQSAVIGQNVSAILTEDLLYKKVLIASAGSVANGTIVMNKKARFKEKNAQTQVRFTTIRTPYNNVIPISATILTDDKSGILKKEVQEVEENDSPLEAIKSFVEKGEPVLLPSNSQIYLYFDQPITIGAQ